MIFRAWILLLVPLPALGEPPNFTATTASAPPSPASWPAWTAIGPLCWT